MTRYFTFFFILLLFSVSVFAQKTHKLKGTIKTQNNEIIAGANLYFEKDGQANVVSANINGEFESELSAGDYKITVNQELSENFVAFVKIQETGLNPNNIDFKIETNSESGNQYPKPIKLSPSIYPAAAIAVAATGEVIVSVKINKDGKVISAKAESGHPLLRSASQKVAMDSAFEAAENEAEREAKLTYVYLLPWKVKEDKNIKRFSNQYRIETIGEIPRLDID